MSFAIDLREHGSDLKKQYESVISSDPETTWAVFGYDGSSNVVKPSATGSGDLDEFTEAFDDARIQYGLVRVEFNSVNKIVLVGWVGENVSARQRLTFNAHMSSVAKQFPGHHIQITARNSDELTPQIILEKVNAAAGSKYAGSTKQAPPTKPAYIQAKEGANEDDWVEVEPVEERDLTVNNNSGYKSSVREELEQLRKGKKPQAPSKDVESPKSSSISGLNSGTSYQPVGKIDLKKIREEAKGSKFADARIEKIEPSYKPVGKVDLKAIREQARKEKEMKAKKESNDYKPEPAKKSSVVEPKQEDSEDEPESKPEPKPEPTLKKTAPKTIGGDDEDEEPKFSSLADRMKAFQNSVSGAKPKYETSSSGSSRPSASPIKKDSKKEDTWSREQGEENEEEEDAPLSVAAQLAKARLSGSKKTEEDAPLPATKREPAATAPASEPKSNVSSFAARFAKQEPPAKASEKEEEEEEKEEEDDKEEEEEDEQPAPPAPRRTPAIPSQQDSDSSEEEAEEDEDKGITAIAIQEYPSGDDDEITLKEGELVIRIQKVDENWWIGENTNGAVGLFPKDYVQVKGEKEDDTKETKNAPKIPEPEPESPIAASADDGKVAIAQYSYEAGDDDELSFAENEKITEVDFPSEDWWSGKNSKGAFGLFPSSYVSLQ